MQSFKIVTVLRILVVFLLASQPLLADGDSLVKKLRLNLNVGMIINRNYSNYPLKNSSDDVSITRYSATPEAPKYRVGFIAGADVLLRPHEKFKFVLGFSISHHKAQYHSSYITEIQTSRPGFTKLTRATENDYQLSYTALNFQAGFRTKLNDDFFLTSALMLNSPLKIDRVLNGYTETIYSNNSGAEERDLIVLGNEKTTLEQKPANLSLNFKVEYQFFIKEVPAQIFLFRNFGLLYALPWWGLGVSYAVIH